MSQGKETTTPGHVLWLGDLQPNVEAALANLQHERIIARIWAHDHTVWKPEPTEITNRLGWLRIAEKMRAELPRLHAIAEAVRRAGYTHALLLGMGGSSLAPEVFRKTFGVAPGYLDLEVLDSTDAEAVRALSQRLDPVKTLYIVSTKSGGTVETFSFLKFFLNQVSQAVGPAEAGAHFIAITDPGSDLADMGHKLGFREMLLNDPNIGGRYSALSLFGLLPAALLGIDLTLLLDRAEAMTRDSGPSASAAENLAARLGAALGALAQAGRDKVTFVMSRPLVSFGDWVEQLIAESTGKEGHGILPVVGESLSGPEVYGPDRVFVHLRLAGDGAYEQELAALVEAGHPVIRLHLRDMYDLGGQFFLWELVTAVAGHLLGINPFDQPDVESAKVQGRKAVAAYKESGRLPDLAAAPLHRATLEAFLGGARAGDYVAIHAYLTPTPETDALLHALQAALRDKLRLAVTVGYGPRFLHSTGQLHKGDGNNGLFIQLLSSPREDVAIPDEIGADTSAIGFGALKLAQALGDGDALCQAGRRLLRFDLGQETLIGLQALLAFVTGVRQ